MFSRWSAARTGLSDRTHAADSKPFRELDVTALMNAVNRNDLLAVQQLIAEGADVDEHDAGSDSYSIIIAAWKGYTVGAS